MLYFGAQKNPIFGPDLPSDNFSYAPLNFSRRGALFKYPAGFFKVFVLKRFKSSPVKNLRKILIISLIMVHKNDAMHGNRYEKM